MTEAVEKVVDSTTMVLRGLDEKTRSAVFIASTDAIDSYDEIVEQTWRLDRYISNPVVLFAHQSRELPIGKSSEVGVVDGKLQTRITFASAEANPKAENVWQSVREGTLRAVSVGFLPGDYRWEKREGREVLVLSNNELLEISVTPIPANAEALAKMRARARGDRKELSMAGEQNETTAALRSALESKDAELAAVRRDLASATERATTAERQRAELTVERDAEKKRADEAAAALKDAKARVVELEIDSVIGVKVLPERKEFLMELSQESPSLFAKEMEKIKKGPDLTQLQRAIPDAKSPPPSTAGTSAAAGDDLAAHINDAFHRSAARAG